MPLRRLPDRDLTYHLIAFDEDGRERTADGPRYSERLCAAIAAEEPRVTDIFVISHGWLGDVPAAISQYDRWLMAMYDQQQDKAAAHRRGPDWRSTVVGLHWPSLPWGDELLPGRPALLSCEGALDDFAAENATDVDTLIGRYARRIADTPRARTALRTILAARPSHERLLTSAIEDAYAVLLAESSLACDGILAPPGADQDSFTPTVIIEQARARFDGRPGPAVLGGSADDRAIDLLRMPLRQLSFWKMKDRARRFGEGGAHQLLRHLHDAAPAARLHLMGHSFGCIVASGAVAGPRGSSLPRRPIDTLFLVQGALSLWAFTDDIPYQRGTPGYFRPILDDRLIRGPLVTTRSTFDTAVGRFYPLGARVARQKVLGEDFPAYGGIGAFGIQGVPGAEDLTMLDDRQWYNFSPGRVHNLEASRIIRHGNGPAGAHSDIAHPAVAHAFWQAALAD
jgi:hypothetical protein